MASLNKVLLIGNLTRAPELRYTPGGSAVCEFGLAMNRKFSAGDGKDRDETCFVDIVVWGKQAENCNRYLEKGSSAFIEGRLNYDQWQDKESGAKRSRLRVVAERVQFLGRAGGNGEGGDNNYGGQQYNGGGNQYGGNNQQYGGNNQQYSGGNQQYGNQSYGNQPQSQPQPQSYPQEQYRPQQQQNQPQNGRQQPPPPPMPEGSFDVDNAEDDIPF